MNKARVNEDSGAFKTKSLSGAPLDWAVGTALTLRGRFGLSVVSGSRLPVLASDDDTGEMYDVTGEDGHEPWQPSTNVAQCGALIELFGISVCALDGGRWSARVEAEEAAQGETMLLAACRALVLASFGSEVFVPDYLLSH